MAIAIDATSQSGEGASNQTWAHTCTGSNLILYVSIFDTATNTTDVTGVTYNGVSLTKCSAEVYTFGGGSAYLYRLIGPATGANNIVVSRSSGYISCTAASYTGVAQNTTDTVTSTATTGAGTATSLTATVVTTAANSWTVAALANNGGTPSAGSGTYLRQIGHNVANALFDSNGALSTGSNSLISTLAGANAMCLVIEGFAPAAAATNIKNVDGVANASIKAVDDVARASIKAIDDVT